MDIDKWLGWGQEKKEAEEDEAESVQSREKREQLEMFNKKPFSSYANIGELIEALSEEGIVVFGVVEESSENYQKARKEEHAVEFRSIPGTKIVDLIRAYRSTGDEQFLNSITRTQKAITDGDDWNLRLAVRRLVKIEKEEEARLFRKS